MTWPTASAIELMCPGVPVTACASMRPSASNRPAARSPDSRTMVENAVRCRVCACSSTTAIRRLHMICVSIRLEFIGLSMLIFRNRFRSRRLGPFGLQPIDFLRRLRRDQFIAEVGLDLRPVARCGVADAPATGRHDQDALADGDEMPALARQLVAGLQADIAANTVATAVKAARRKLDALEGTVEIERFLDAVFHFDDLAETAAPAAGAARIPAIFLAPDDHGRHRFENLDRPPAHAARKSRR